MATFGTFVAGQVLTAAELNYTGAAGWTSYTPTLVQSGAVTKTVTYARYEKIGRKVTVALHLAVTGPGTSNTAINVGLPSPVPAATGSEIVGAAYLTDASGSATYQGSVIINATTAFVIFGTTSTAFVPLGLTSSPFGAALASGDVIAASFTYEATS